MPPCDDFEDESDTIDTSIEEMSTVRQPMPVRDEDVTIRLALYRACR